VSQEQPKNPLHGVTLRMIIEDLVERRGWDYLAERVNVGCFTNEPTINSSLKLLRKIEWARVKVERIYLDDLKRQARNARKEAKAEAEATLSEEAADVPEAVEPVD
jgi:uncharacterized protein (DUF2132 family)